MTAQIRYADGHMWVSLEGGVATVGITARLQELLGTIVLVKLPATGLAVAQGETVAVIESVKASSDVPAPLGGTITETNSALDSEASLANTDPTGSGWLFRIGGVDAGAFAALSATETN